MPKDSRPRTAPKNKIVGIVSYKNGQYQIDGCDKKERLHFALEPRDMNGAKNGDVVVAARQPGSSFVKVTRILGQRSTPGIETLISICEKGLSETFTQTAMSEAKTMSLPSLQGREDLRSIPLVTIDGADARDFDDAVFAEKTPDGGYHLIVAIADVSWYVKQGSALDQEAYQRGNSTYFPDKVLPMLPEDLSNGLCSLKPNEDRACMAFHLFIDKDGNLTKQKVTRGLMRSAARLTYEQVQAAKDGQTDATTAPLMKTVINPLYEAYTALRKARVARGAMELDMPEYKVSVDDKGNAADVGKAERPESCKVIEEFMVLANVAAAKALESQKAPCVYRVHETPPYIDELREILDGYGLKLPANVKSAKDFKEVLEKAAQMPNGHQVIKAVMRAQAKARYDAKNTGHFGLALEHYAHFTSPIRRYADLIVHRSLVEAFNLGSGGLTGNQKAEIQKMAEHVSETEKLSTNAERSSHDRLAAKYMTAHVGEVFTGRIVGVTNAGLFVNVDKSGATGLLPRGRLPNDHYTLDEKKHTLTGGQSGQVYRSGETINVRLTEADSLMGSILLAPANDNRAGAPDFRAKPRPQPDPRKPRF